MFMNRSIKIKGLINNRQRNIILLVGFIIVLFIGGSMLFSGWGAYNVGVGATARTSVSIAAGSSINEDDMLSVGSNLYIILLFEGDMADRPDGYMGPADNSQCSLVCVENNVSVGIGVDGYYATRVAIPGDPVFYNIMPYFTLDISGVYKEEHSYKIVLTGEIVGESFVFKIVGDANSPIYSDDGNGNGNNGGDALPTEPSFIEKPVDATFENSTPSNETLTWVVEDDNLAHYYLYYNDTLLKEGSIVLDKFTYVVEIYDYGVGVYVFEFVVVDGDNNTITDEVTITVFSEGELPFDIEEWLSEPINMIIVVVVVFMIIGGGKTARDRAQVIVIEKRG